MSAKVQISSEILKDAIVNPLEGLSDAFNKAVMQTISNALITNESTVFEPDSSKLSIEDIHKIMETKEIIFVDGPLEGTKQTFSKDVNSYQVEWNPKWIYSTWNMTLLLTYLIDDNKAELGPKSKLKYAKIIEKLKIDESKGAGF